MVAPLTVRVQAVPSPLPQEPLDVVFIGPKQTDGSFAADTLTQITQTNALAGLGKAGAMKRAYDTISSAVATRNWALPYTDSNDEATLVSNMNDAINAMSKPEEKAKIDGSPFVVVIPEVTGAHGNAAFAPLATLRTVVQTLRGGVIFADAAQDSFASTSAWLKANSGAGQISMCNDATFNGVANTSGAIIAAAHYLRNFSGNFGVNPIGTTYPIQGISTPSPSIPFDPISNAQAELFDDEYGTSIIEYGGNFYLWGGKMQAAVGGSDLEVVGHRIVTFDLTRQMQDLLLRYVGRLATTAVFLQISSQASALISPRITTGQAESASLTDVTVDSTGHLTATLNVAFADPIEAAILTVSVG